jgi:hypothetical protein
MISASELLKVIPGNNHITFIIHVANYMAYVYNDNRIIKAYIAFQKQRDPSFNMEKLEEDTPRHICAYIFKKCDFKGQKDDNGKDAGCEGKSV